MCLRQDFSYFVIKVIKWNLSPPSLFLKFLGLLFKKFYNVGHYLNLHSEENSAQFKTGINITFVKEKFFFEIFKTASLSYVSGKMHLKTLRSIVRMGKRLGEGLQLDANQAQEEV